MTTFEIDEENGDYQINQENGLGKDYSSLFGGKPVKPGCIARLKYQLQVKKFTSISKKGNYRYTFVYIPAGTLICMTAFRLTCSCIVATERQCDCLERTYGRGDVKPNFFGWARFVVVGDPNNNYKTQMFHGYGQFTAMFDLMVL